MPLLRGRHAYYTTVIPEYARAVMIAKFEAIYNTAHRYVEPVEGGYMVRKEIPAAVAPELITTIQPTGNFSVPTAYHHLYRP